MNTKLVAAVVTLATLAAVSGAAQADVSKGQCVDANTLGQSLRREGKLAAARAELRTCADATCPEIVRADCIQRLDELERAQPTIVFAAKDAAGRDLTAVKVTVDGEPFADKLDGTALPANAGSHTFVFEVPGQAKVTQTYVLREGQKGRAESIVLDVGSKGSGETPPRAKPVALPDTPSPAANGGLGGQKIAAIAIGGVGLAGIVVGAIFGAKAKSDFEQQQADCPAAGCANHAQAVIDHDNVTTAATISTIGFVAGGALVAGSIVLFLTAPKRASATTSGALHVVPSVAPSGGGIALGGSF